MISTYEIHHTTTPCRQLLTAERTQNEGVMDAFYIQEVTPKVVANAVRIVIRICKIFFQTGLFIIVNNGFEQFLHACRRTSRHMKRSNTSRKTFQHDSQNILTCNKKRPNIFQETFSHISRTILTCLKEHSKTSQGTSHHVPRNALTRS